MDKRKIFQGQHVICIEKEISWRINKDLNEEIILYKEYIINEFGFKEIFYAPFLNYNFIKVKGLETYWNEKSFILLEDFEPSNEFLEEVKQILTLKENLFI